jgi:hypothetical protein
LNLFPIRKEKKNLIGIQCGRLQLAVADLMMNLSSCSLDINWKNALLH